MRHRLTIMTLSSLAALLAFAACDDVIYDYEGDCDPTYRLAFRYDMNMEKVDEFAGNVESVSVYAFGEDGKLAWQGTEEGEALGEEGYSMALPLRSGKYRLVAWCGLSGDGTHAVPEMEVGASTLSDLRCSLVRRHDAEGGAYIGSDLSPLYHGLLDAELPADEDGGRHTVTMPLTKDTHWFRVMLQNLSGEAMDPSDFSFTIEADNGLMAYDNSLLEDEVISYRAWNVESWSAAMEDETKTQSGTLLADVSTGRMVPGRKVSLVVRGGDGDTVLSIPLIDYALLIKGHYDKSMTDQEYLDRQDGYSMTFFLDEDGSWAASSILINSWRVVLSQEDIE